MGFVFGMVAIIIGGIAAVLAGLHVFVTDPFWMVVFAATGLIGLTFVTWGGQTVFSALPTVESTESQSHDPLATLRERYIQGELSEEQFERELDTLLETDTSERAADRQREDSKNGESDREESPARTS